MWKKPTVSVGLMLLATNALASGKSVITGEVDESLEPAIKQALETPAVRVNMGERLGALANNIYLEQEQNLFEAVAHEMGVDPSSFLAQKDDSTTPISGSTSYAACYSNCHSACAYSSRGWR